MRRKLLVEFIVEDMLHAGPEIHGECPQLNLCLHPAGSIEQHERNGYNDVKTLIPVRLRLGDIVFDFQHLHILADTQMIYQPVDILYKGADNPHAGDIMNVQLHILQGELIPLAVHLSQDALGFLNP
ncbi:hypothetical protein D3C80_1197920 [compost metagenome]